MVGLSIVLEAQKGINKKTPQVINKITMMTKPTPFPSPPARWNSHSPLLPAATTFLDECFLCKQKLLPGKDIYMYKGDRAFCSVECRCRQIFMDEEETVRRDNCSLAAMKPTSASSCPSSSSPSSSTSSRLRKGTRTRAGGFAY
ncbi:hypothetical protein AAG906_027818 [Vitis piasezkii]|uniref:FLZ-type domain-containing protein n=2 Tax=Vitis vinifera TaxID=29760 RepID=D7SYC3_VITVI|eukprot:XP_002270507.1 PREDICTED: uncharacterized protein LOC100261891 [Vitis vinifera]